MKAFKFEENDIVVTIPFNRVGQVGNNVGNKVGNNQNALNQTRQTIAEESCEHYAVIDNEIVWYGSMNLLSKEDAEDNLMRVCSKDIAAELLEMTFGSGVDMQEW